MSRANKKYTDGQKRRMRKLHKEGSTLFEIAKKIGCSEQTVRRAVSAKYDEQCRQRQREARERDYVGAKPHSYAPKTSSMKTDEDAMRLKEQIPPDTRDLTARLMGDPLPGRRAIDKIKENA